MSRYVLSLLLVFAVGVFGVLPHAAMAGQAQAPSASCHQTHDLSNGHAAMHDPCDTADHSGSGACAIACLGSIAATWFSAPDVMPADLHPMVHRAAAPRVLNGRTAETADRPPKSL